MDLEAGIFQIRSLESLLSRRNWLYNALAGLFTSFAGVSVLLTMAGLYALVAANARHRLMEYSIRLALRARPIQIFKQAVSAGMAQLGIGIVAGWLLTYPIAGRLESLVYGISLSFWHVGAASALLSLVGFSAACLPAWRASRMNPQSPMRQL